METLHQDKERAMLTSLQQFSTLPAGVRKGIGFLFAGWAVFYVLLFQVMGGESFPIRVKLVGVACCLCILTLKNWARVICLLGNLMIFLQFGFVFVGFAMAGKPMLAAVTGAMLVFFVLATVFLLKRESALFFKSQGGKEEKAG
jgi:hypothetical protein